MVQLQSSLVMGHFLIEFRGQVFDRKVTDLPRDEYCIKRVTKVTANTLEELADKLQGVDKTGFLVETDVHNKTVRADIAFNSNTKDGRRTHGLSLSKPNCTNTIDEGPLEACKLGCGVTFTFGGLRIDPDN